MWVKSRTTNAGQSIAVVTTTSLHFLIKNYLLQNALLDPVMWKTQIKYLGVGPGACAAAARLDSKQVVEYGADKVVVEETPARLVSDEEGEDGETRHRSTAEDD